MAKRAHKEALQITATSPNELICLRIKDDYRKSQGLVYDTLKIGLDLSVDSTGLCLIMGNQCCGALFVSSMPPIDDYSTSINYVPYNKSYATTSYSAKEFTKMLTMRTLANKVCDFVSMYLQQLWPLTPQYIQIVVEGAAYGYMQKNSSSLVELTMYRAVVQDALYHMFPLGTQMSFDVLAPKAVKKEFTGDGSADKLKIIETCIHKFEDFHWCGKVDDFCDAFALATSKQVSKPSPRLW